MPMHAIRLICLGLAWFCLGEAGAEFDFRTMPPGAFIEPTRSGMSYDYKHRGFVEPGYPHPAAQGAGEYDFFDPPPPSAPPADYDPDGPDLFFEVEGVQLSSNYSSLTDFCISVNEEYHPPTAQFRSQCLGDEGWFPANVFRPTAENFWQQTKRGIRQSARVQTMPVLLRDELLRPGAAVYSRRVRQTLDLYINHNEYESCRFADGQTCGTTSGGEPLVWHDQMAQDGFQIGAISLPLLLVSRGDLPANFSATRLPVQFDIPYAMVATWRQHPNVMGSPILFCDDGAGGVATDPDCSNVEMFLYANVADERNSAPDGDSTLLSTSIRGETSAYLSPDSFFLETGLTDFQGVPALQKILTGFEEPITLTADVPIGRITYLNLWTAAHARIGAGAAGHLSLQMEAHLPVGFPYTRVDPDSPWSDYFTVGSPPPPAAQPVDLNPGEDSGRPRPFSSYGDTLLGCVFVRTPVSPDGSFRFFVLRMGTNAASLPNLTPLPNECDPSQSSGVNGIVPGGFFVFAPPEGFFVIDADGGSSPLAFSAPKTFKGRPIPVSPDGFGSQSVHDENHLYFGARDQDGLSWVFRTDGTVAGTEAFARVATPVDAHTHHPLLFIGDWLYFTISTQPSSGEGVLHRVNRSTGVVENLPVPGLYRVTTAEAAGNRLVFEGIATGNVSDSVWVVAPEGGAPQPLQDLSAGVPPDTRFELLHGSSIVRRPLRAAIALLEGSDGQVWSTDGSTVEPILSLPAGSRFGNHDVAWHDGQLYFAVNPSGPPSLWRTQGTAATTLQVPAPWEGEPGELSWLTRNSGVLLYVRREPVTAEAGGYSGSETSAIWAHTREDHHHAVTVATGSLEGPAFSSYDKLMNVGDYLFAASVTFQRVDFQPDTPVPSPPIHPTLAHVPATGLIGNGEEAVVLDLASQGFFLPGSPLAPPSGSICISPPIEHGGDVIFSDPFEIDPPNPLDCGQ